MSQHYDGRSAHAGLHTSTAPTEPTTASEPLITDGDPHSSTHPFHNPHEHVVPQVAAAATTAEANRAHYDANAEAYDRMEMANEVAEKAAAAMRRVYAFDEERTECMDYACGTGAHTLFSGSTSPFRSPSL
jgi:hypothetical protein